MICYMQTVCHIIHYMQMVCHMICYMQTVCHITPPQAAMDRSVGLVLQALKDAGVDDNTFVFFASDNG